jgi:hypothetical protein
VVGLLALVLAACAAGPNTEVGTPGSNGDVAGFWMGLWHGIIAPVTFIISLFDSDVNLYEVHNNGNFYDVGFVLGAGIFLGAGRSGGRQAPVPGRRRDR